jgi:vacuolar protein sorting-associated protein 18
MTTAEVEDFGFADNAGLYSHIRSPVTGTNGAVRDNIDDDDQGFFSTGLGDAPLEMFNVERAQLNLNITILQLVVSNGILVMASTDSKIYKIDLTVQEQIVGTVLFFTCLTVELELQKKQGENKKISKIFLDISGDHLLVNTEAGETFYFSIRSNRAGRGRPVSRLNNIHIESIAWNIDATPSTTKDILIGTRDGAILETYLEISDYIPNARYLRQLRNFGNPIIGLHVEKTTGEGRNVFIATRTAANVFSGRINRKANDISPVYTTFFDEASSGQFQELSGTNFPTRLSVLPRSGADIRANQLNAYFAWTTAQGIFHGNVNSPKSSGDDSIFSDSTLLPYASLFSKIAEGKLILPDLSQFHILLLHENQLVAINRFNNRVVFKEALSTVYSIAS